MNKKVIYGLATMLLASNISLAAPNYNYQPAVPQQPSTYMPQERTNYSGTPLKGRVVTVPAGQIVSGVVASMPLSSETLTLGQQVYLTLGSDFYYNNNLIAPAGSQVMGSVIEVSKAKHGSMNGKLQLRFTMINTPYGQQVPISAIIKTEDGTGVLVGGTKTDVAKAYAKDMGVGAGAGALTGLVASAISGGALGKGTAIMTGVGAGVGLAKSVYDKGNDVEIPANASLQLMLTQPITVNPSANNYNYDY